MAASRDGEFVELTFTLTDEKDPILRLTRERDCRAELLDIVQGSNGGSITQFFLVRGTPSDVVETTLRDAETVESVDIIEAFNGKCIAEVTLPQSIAGTLADLRTLPQSVVYVDGVATISALLPPARAPNHVASSVKDRHPTTELVGKQRRGLPPQFVTRFVFQVLLDDTLTDRQVRALELAYRGGYFDRPRRHTQAELADEMGVTPSTFSQHLTTGLRKLLEAFFERGRQS